MVRDVRYITLNCCYRDLHNVLLTGHLKTLALVESAGETQTHTDGEGSSDFSFHFTLTQIDMHFTNMHNSYPAYLFFVFNTLVYFKISSNILQNVLISVGFKGIEQDSFPHHISFHYNISYIIYDTYVRIFSAYMTTAYTLTCQYREQPITILIHVYKCEN